MFDNLTTNQAIKNMMEEFTPQESTYLIDDMFEYVLEVQAQRSEVSGNTLKQYRLMRYLKELFHSLCEESSKIHYIEAQA